MVAGDVTVGITSLTTKSCAVFDGVSNYIEIAHSKHHLGDISFANGFTLSAWIFPRSAGEGGGGDFSRIFDKTNSSVSAVDGFKMQISSNRLLVKINNGTSRQSAVNSVSYDEWTHVLATISTAGVVRCYIDGVLSGSPGISAAVSGIVATNALKIGNRSDNTDKTFDGGIRDAKIFNRVLSDDEALQEATSGDVTDSLLNHWKLISDYNDSGPLGLDGTNSGTSFTIFDEGLTTSLASQRATAGANGTYLVTNLGQGKQMLHSATEET